MGGCTVMGRCSSPAASCSAAAWMGASPASHSARRTSACPLQTAPTHGVWTSQGSAALSGSARPESGTSCRALGQPVQCRTPASRGAQSGAPARPPAAWASPPASPTRTPTAGWRHSGGSACSGPARLCRRHPLRGDEEGVCSRAHPGCVPEPMSRHRGWHTSVTPWFWRRWKTCPLGIWGRTDGLQLQRRVEIENKIPTTCLCTLLPRAGLLGSSAQL